MNLNSNPSSTAHDPAPRMQRRGRQAGFNLVELMVAVAIGGLLLTGALSIFVNNQQLQKATSSMSRLQEDARYAMDLLVYDLRMAGFVGCSDDSSMVTVSSTLPTASTNLLWNLAMPIEGIDQSMIGSTPPEDLVWYPSNLPADKDLPAKLRTDSDLLTLRYVNGSVNHEITAASSSELTIDDAGQFQQLDVVVAHDCGGADVFYVANADPTGDGKVTAASALSKVYNPSGQASQVSDLVGVRYYIANHADTDEPGLYRREILDRGIADATGITETEPTAPIVEGVEMMQILYGIDTNNDRVPDKFVDANAPDLGTNAGYWNEIVAIQVSLLLRTNEPLQQSAGMLASSYQVGTASFTPTSDQQRFQFRTFQTTVLVRNQR